MMKMIMAFISRSLAAKLIIAAVAVTTSGTAITMAVNQTKTQPVEESAAVED